MCVCVCIYIYYIYIYIYIIYVYTYTCVCVYIYMYRWPEARHLVDALVCHDPSRRPSAAQALLHPFFWSHVRPQPYSLSHTHSLTHSLSHSLSPSLPPSLPLSSLSLLLSLSLLSLSLSLSSLRLTLSAALALCYPFFLGLSLSCIPSSGATCIEKLRFFFSCVLRGIFVSVDDIWIL